MKKIFFLALFLFWAIPSGFTQPRTYTFEEATKLAKENPKPLVVFIHTNWCKYCKIMENSTFKNQKIINLLNDRFYFVSLDAETKTDIIFKNHIFKFKPTGQNTGIHELATALATIEGQIIYPTITFLDTNYSILFQKHSYLESKSLFSMLQNIK